jgi:hypothetical protein
MTGLQPHHYLARRDEIMRAKREGARTGLQKIRIALRALKTRSKGWKLDSNFQDNSQSMK